MHLLAGCFSREDYLSGSCSSVVVTENYLKDFESRVARRAQSKHSPIAHLNLGKLGGDFKKSSTDILDE